MNCTKIHIIGCDERTLPREARDVLRRWGTLDAEYPDTARALNTIWMTENEIRLFMLQVVSEDELEDLKRIAAKFPGRPILAIVELTDDSTMLLKALRAGATQAVASPVSAVDLLDALDCIAKQIGNMETPAKTIAVTGASGGCGATAIAINLAYEIAVVQKQRCILLELSLRKGAIANHLDIQPRYTTADLVSEIRRVDSYILNSALTQRADGFSVLVGPYQSIETTTPDAAAAMQLVEAARRLADVVVLDVPGTFDDLYFQALSTADQVVLVTEQTVSSIRGAQMVCEVLEQHRPLIVVNRFGRKTNGLSVERLRQFLRPCELQTVAYDERVIQSMNNGASLRECNPRSVALPDLDALAETLAPRQAEQSPAEKPASIFGKLTRVFSHS
jgi:pilus assembly protein CpaE